MSMQSQPDSKPSTTEQGNAFRDHVCRVLAAAGFHEVQAEVRVGFKKVDGSCEWVRHTIDGRLRVLIEAKDYAGTLPKQECVNFVTEYGTLTESDAHTRAWLVSRGPFTPDGRELIEQNARRGLRCFTYAELQRHLLQLDGYLMDMVSQFRSRGVEQFYIRPHAEKDVGESDLEELVRAWMEQPNAAPLAIVGGYGKGKSTFALHLAAAMAQQALTDPLKRVPILVPLGEIVDEQAVDGLIGKVLASQYRVDGYHYHLFKELNTAGRFLIIFDGLDEMKHGMTPAMFVQNVNRLLELDRGDARILILGRDTVFQDDLEFRAVILGRQMTAAGTELPARGRRALSQVTLRGFTLPEARQFVQRYFPLKAREDAARNGTSADEAWVTARTAELLSGAFDGLLERPVHAQMLCEIATDPQTSLTDVSTFRLYDVFVHYLLEREASKPGRFPGFTAIVRRRFNAAVAWWLWEGGGATTTTFADLPTALCTEAAVGIAHGFDDEGLKRELTVGCLVEKGGSTVYFGHRSIQEFLVAEHLFATSLLRRKESGRGDVARVWPLLSPVVSDFLVERLIRSSDKVERAREWLGYIENWPGSDASLEGIGFFARLIPIAGLSGAGLWRSPWYILAAYLHENGPSTFLPTPGGFKFAASLLKGLSGKPLRVQAAVLYVWARLLRSEAPPRDAVARLLAHLLPRDIVRQALNDVRDTRGAHRRIQVRREDTLPLWAFLTATVVKREPSRELVVELDLRRLCKVMLGAMDLKLLDGDADALSSVVCPVQAIYHAMTEQGTSNRDLDSIRPFFNDDQLRACIRPLAVTELTSRPGSPRPPRRGRPPRI